MARKRITADVIEVVENATSLDPTMEIAEIQRLINSHNEAVRKGTAPASTLPLEIQRRIFYTGYLISHADSERLRKLVPNVPKNKVTFTANHILITPRPCPPHLLERIGGIGKRLRWRVTGLAVLESKLWAARVEPVPSTATYYSDNPTPTVVLAMRRDARVPDATRIQSWHPVPATQTIEFDTVVGENVLLKIEKERPGRKDRETVSPQRPPAKRPHSRDREYPPLGSSGPPKQPQGSQPWGQRRDYTTDDRRRSDFESHRGGGYRGGNPHRGRANSRPGRGGRGGHARGGGNSRARGRGGGSGHYKSLDDVGERSYGGHHGQGYEDGHHAGGGNRDGGFPYNAY